MATRLVLVRHARTPSNEGGLLDTRVPGPALTEEGTRQATQLRHILTARNIDPSTIGALYVSDMVRTHLTAAFLAAEAGLRPAIRGGIREISAGNLGMRNDASAREEYMALVAHWARGDLDQTVTGGEDGHAFFARFDEVVREVETAAAQSGHHTVAFISHGAAIRCWAASRAVNLTADFAAENLLNNLDTVTLERNADRNWVATSWADVPLPTPNP